MRGTSRKRSKPQTEWVLGKSSTANGRATGREAETPGRQGRLKNPEMAWPLFQLPRGLMEVQEGVKNMTETYVQKSEG